MGAALLAGHGALRAGAGVLRIATCQQNAPQLGVAMPEAMVIGLSETADGEIAPENSQRLVELAASSDAVLIGAGMLNETATGELTSKILRAVEGPYFALDAAAFTSLRDSDLPMHQHEKVVCTPHHGEMAKFLKRERSDVEAEALPMARLVAGQLRAVVALKGQSTYVVSPQGDAVLNATAPSGWPLPAQEMCLRVY